MSTASTSLKISEIFRFPAGRNLSRRAADQFSSASPVAAALRLVRCRHHWRRATHGTRRHREQVASLRHPPASALPAANPHPKELPATADAALRCRLRRILRNLGAYDIARSTWVSRIVNLKAPGSGECSKNLLGNS